MPKIRENILIVSIYFIIVNSMTILAYDSVCVEDILKNNIILCTGPSYNRKKLLRETIECDLELIPFKKIFVATNDYNNLDLQIIGQEIFCQFFSSRDKQLDCLNCIIVSIKCAANDPDCLDEDIILFKHESVFINDMNLIKKAIGKIMEGYEMVIKNWIGYEDRPDLTHLKDYCHTDSFFIKVSAARKLFKNHLEVDCFIKGDFHFCEEYFTKYIVNKLLKPYKIDYRHSSWKDNELGLYHIPRFEEDSSWYWDKKNYDDLYK